VTELLSSSARRSIAGFEIGATGVTPPSNPDRRGVFLDDVVVELGLADREAMDAAVQSAQQAEKTFERYVLESGVLDEEQLSRALAERNGLDHIDLDQFPVDTGAAEMVTRSAAERYRAVPVAFAADGAVIVAVEDPFDSLGLSDIEAITRSEVRPAIAAASGIRTLIEKLPEQSLSRPPVVAEEVEEIEEPAPAVLEEEPIVVNVAPPPKVAAPEPPLEVEPSLDVEPPPSQEQTTEEEPVVEDETVVNFGNGLVETQTPVESPDGYSPVLEPVVDPAPESEPESEPVSGPTEIESELGSLQEVARRSDELAGNVERRINELKSADERSVQLEADLDVAQRRVGELEERISGVDTLAEELRATTAKLEEVNRVLEGSVG
jgi:MshEN domain